MIKRQGRIGSAATMLAAAIITAGAALPAAAAPGAPLPAGTPSPVQSPADIARGKALFTGTCGAYCHRPSAPTAGAAASDAPSLFDCNWKHGGTDAQIFQTITKGVAGTRMVAFGGALPDDDIRRIIAYLRSGSQCPASPPR